MPKRGMAGPFVGAYHSASPPCCCWLLFCPVFALDIFFIYFFSISSFWCRLWHPSIRRAPHRLVIVEWHNWSRSALLKAAGSLLFIIINFFIILICLVPCPFSSLLNDGDRSSLPCNLIRLLYCKSSCNFSKVIKNLLTMKLTVACATFIVFHQPGGGHSRTHTSDNRP